MPVVMETTKIRVVGNTFLAHPRNAKAQIPKEFIRLAGECPDPQQIGRESLDVEEWEREAGAATEWRWHGVEAGGKP